MLLNADDHLRKYALSTLNAVATPSVGRERTTMSPYSKYKFRWRMTFRRVSLTWFSFIVG